MTKSDPPPTSMPPAKGTKAERLARKRLDARMREEFPELCKWPDPNAD